MDKEQYFGIENFSSEDELNYLKDLNDIYKKYSVLDENGIHFSGKRIRNDEKLSKSLERDLRLFDEKHEKFINKLKGV